MESVQYLYHGVPEQMVGTKLIPLNQMPGSMQKLRDEYLEKYEGREEILERKIPLLDCLWNDVVQFLPLHPRKVFELQRDLGIIPEVPHYKFFEVNIDSLDPKQTVVFFKTAVGEENVEVKWLEDVDCSTFQEIPHATVEYFKSVVGTGELPFNYQFIPHVVHKGKVNVSRSRIITI